MTHAEKAVEIFMNGYNCSQAVCAAFADVMGLDEKTALRISSCFGGGFVRLREVCGAVSGMCIVFGMLYGNADGGDFLEKARHYQNTRRIIDKFKNEFGSIICRDLLGAEGKANEPTPSQRTEAYYGKRPCMRHIAYACDLLDEYIAAHGLGALEK